LWTRFATVLGIEPDSIDTSVARPNASLGAAEVTFLRQVNAALSQGPGRRPDRALRGPYVKGLLAQDVLAQRGALLGEYLWYVNQIIAYMRTHGDVMERNETARMADYARFARAVSAVLGWPLDTIDELMAAIAHERDTFINEDDPLVQLLEHWVKKNARRPVTVQKLFSDLDALAPMLGATFYKSPRVLAQKAELLDRQSTLLENMPDAVRLRDVLELVPQLDRVEEEETLRRLRQEAERQRLQQEAEDED
jgi:hypothetical protein